MKIFTNHRYALITGIVLAVILSFVLHNALMPDAEFNHLSLARWVHIVSGVFWIGLLYYLNAVQVPGHGVPPPKTRAAPAPPPSANTSRRARCSGSAGPRSSPGLPAPGCSPNASCPPSPSAIRTASHDYQTVVIGIGAWLGTIMFAQRVGHHLAEPEEGPRHQAGHG